MTSLTDEDCNVIPEDIEGDYNAISRSLKAFKTVMTRIDNRINAKVDVLQSGNGSDVVIAQLRKLSSAYTRVGYCIVALADGLNDCEGNTTEMRKAHNAEADKAENAMAVQDMKINAPCVRNQASAILRPWPCAGA